MIDEKRETQHILISRDASIRSVQNKDKHHQQSVDMKNKWVEQQRIVREPVDMAQALAQVRTSDVSIPHQLSRYMGTTLYNTIPPKR